MNLSSFDLNLLRVLNALLIEQSTVRAGQRLGLSQSAVSAALGRLRAAMGDPLFVRQGQRIVPTDHALSLEAPLQAVLDDMGRLLAGGDGFDPARTAMRFTISGADFFAEMLMPRLAAMMALRAPRSVLHLVDLVPDNHVASLENSEIDLALVPRTAFPSWIETELLFRAPYRVIARRGHERLAQAGLSPGDAVPMDLYCALGHVLFSPEGRASADGDDALAQVGRTRRVVMTLPVFSGVVSAVVGSDLIALLPGQLARQMVQRTQIDIFEPPMPIPAPELFMLWHRRATRNPSHVWLREQVAEVLRPLDPDDVD